VQCRYGDDWWKVIARVRAREQQRRLDQARELGQHEGFTRGYDAARRELESAADRPTVVLRAVPDGADQPARRRGRQAR